MDTTVAIAFLCLLAGELLVLCFNISKLRNELGERQEKLTSELSEIKKLLQK
jgi:hypothetical protein